VGKSDSKITTFTAVVSKSETIFFDLPGVKIGMDVLPYCSRWVGTTQMGCHHGKKYRFAAHPAN